MQFLYHPEAGKPWIEVEGDAYRHLFKVRRLHADSPLHLRNLTDDLLYTYRTETLDRRRARLRLVEQQRLRIAPERRLHLGWCQVDPKTVEKALPALNEMGVSRITFFPCERSQRSFRPDFDRLRRILINSSQQCGRSELMSLEECESLSAFLAEEPEAMLLDFSPRPLACDNGEALTLVVGCEGGFTEAERKCFAEERIVGLDTPMILRSESAACAAAARFLLG